MLSGWSNLVMRKDMVLGCVEKGNEEPGNGVQNFE